MQIKLEMSELSWPAYFALDAGSLEPMRRRDVVSVLWTPLPGTELRVALLVAPLEHAWGMQFRHCHALHQVVEEKLGDDYRARSMQRELEELGFGLDVLAPTLLGSSVFGLEEQLAVGHNVPDLPHAVYRAIHLPDNREDFERFIKRLDDHIRELGRFFLCTVPPDVNFPQWAEEEDERLTEIFYRPARGRRKGEQMDAHLDAIRLALQGVERGEAEKWLTPRFLEWEQVRPTYPLPAALSTSRRVLGFFDMLNLRPMDQLLDQKQNRTLLQLELVKKWKWPLGLRNLYKAQTSEELRKTMLGDSDAWEPAEALVSEILEEGKHRFPVLFT